MLKDHKMFHFSVLYSFRWIKIDHLKATWNYAPVHLKVQRDRGSTRMQILIR